MLAPVQVCIVLRLRNRVFWLVFNLPGSYRRQFKVNYVIDLRSVGSVS